MSETNLLDEELKMLVRASRNERFRFIIIQYNHFRLIEKVKETLVKTYLNRNSCTINLNKISQKEFIQNILNCETGFVFIEEFEKLLEEEFRSLAIGFNQRRDKFSEYPITIIAFLPTGEKYLQQCQTIMPDMFSLVNPIIQLKFEELNFINQDEIFIEINPVKEIEKNIIIKNEILKLKKRLKSLEISPANINLKFNLIQQIGDYLAISKNFKQELILYYKFIISKDFDFINNRQLSILLDKIGYLNLNVQNYENALAFFERALKIRIKENGEKSLITAVSFNNIALLYDKIGNIEKANEYYNKALILKK